MTRWKLFSYLSIDHKSAQADLNAMAEKGWRLVKIYGGLFARFERSDRADLTYFVDLADSQHREEPAYLALCADAGWDEVCAPRYMRIYESRPGLSPAPIQTDGGVEYERFLRVVLRRMLIGWGFLIPILLLFTVFMWQLLDGNLLRGLYFVLLHSFMGNFLLLTFPALFLGQSVYLISLLLRLRAWNALRLSGTPIPVPPFARLRGMLTVLGSLFYVLLFVTMALDVGTNHDTPFEGYFIGLLLAIPLLFWLRKHRPKRRVHYFGNPVLYMFLLACLLRFFLPGGAVLPFTVTPAPIPEALTRSMTQVERQSCWLSTSEFWFNVPQGAEQVDLSTRRFTLRTPGLAEAVRAYYQEPYMEPVPGLENTWWDPEGRSPWGISEVLLLRGSTVWYFKVSEPNLSPDVPARLDAIIAGTEATP